MKNRYFSIYYFGIILALALPTSVNALSCGIKTQFIIRCESNVCTKGFFAFRRLAGNWCESILDVKGDEEIYAFDGNLEGLKREKEILDGYYAIQMDTKFDPKRDVFNSHCFRLSENKTVSVSCLMESSRTITLFPIPFGYQNSLEEVRQRLAQQSKTERLHSLLFAWIPVLLAVLLFSFLFYKFKSRRGILVSGTTVVSFLICISEAPYGQRSLFVIAFFMLLFCICWMLFRLWNVCRRRIKRPAKK